ncbi:MAG: exodeoxyribonuclease V subunit gamma [Desulfosoma sp.]
MWRVVQSQRMERLLEAFLRSLEGPLEATGPSAGVGSASVGEEIPAFLEKTPPPQSFGDSFRKDPFIPEVVVVQDMGMARWITHGLAQEFGIAANLRFLVPAALVDLVYSAWLEDDASETAAEAWSRPALTWRLFRLLDICRRDERFCELHHYMADDPSGRKRYELAGRIAAVFDRYLVYRQDVLLSWEGGEGDGWQPQLWRLLVEDIPEAHQARRHQRFMEQARRGRRPRRPELLPHRVSLFGLAMIAPVHLEVFHILASHIPVTLYYLNPSREYWGDVRPMSADSINPLMASWAQAGRYLLDRVQEIHGYHEDRFDDIVPDALLKAVQHDIHTLTDRRTAVPEDRLPVADFGSIQIHACHSPMREIQVLHDRIAHFLETLPGLTPEDIVVMAPDIDTYAPYVEAVFGTRDNPRLPWNLSERKSPDEDPLLEKILDLLRLPQWRCTAAEILALLETPAVAAAYGFDEKGLERVRAWVRDTGIRWGLDEAMRHELNLPRDRSHTWRMGLERLLAGYAMPPQEIFWRDVLSYPHVEPGDAAWLGALHDLLDTLDAWRRRLQVPKTPAQWQRDCNALVDSFFTRKPAPGDAFQEFTKEGPMDLPRRRNAVSLDPEVEESLDRFRNAVDAVCSAAEEAGCSDPVSIDVIRDSLRNILAESPNIRRFLSGGVTFCNLVPMRAIPFRVVWLLGMNDADFPRSERPPQFDLTAQDPRPGDRRRRWEDRYLFLEALLSARDVFCVSYVGRDIRDNSERVPSVVVSELLDYVESSYRIQDDHGDEVLGSCWGSLRSPQPTGFSKADARAADACSPIPSLRSLLRVEHPLQPFSRRLFDGSDPRLFSYDAQWLEAAQTREDPALPPFMPPEAALPTPEIREIALDELVRFFENPSAYFLEKRLGLALLRPEDPVEEDEPFAPNTLDRYWLASEITDALLRGDDVEALRRRIRARGALPHGAAGDVVFDDVYQSALDLAQKVLSQAGSVRRQVEVDITVEGVRIFGRIGDVTERGRLTYRPAAIKAKDRLRLWIRHLGLCAARPDGVFLGSVHIGTGKNHVFRLEPVSDPESFLADLVRFWVEGQEKPLPFFPESSWAYAKKCGGAPSPHPPARLCGTAWEDRYRELGDAYDPAVRTAFRGLDPLDGRFAEIACGVFGPLVKEAKEN